MIDTRYFKRYLPTLIAFHGLWGYGEFALNQTWHMEPIEDEV